MAYTTINKHTDYFNTKLYTGNGSVRTETGVGFQPDWTWIKDRDGTNAHVLTDAVRGANYQIYTNLTNAQTNASGYLTAFASDGFTLGTDGAVNANSTNYVSWNWKAGTTSGLSGGTITPSAYSINTTSGFGIYKYTGNSTAGASIAHGLGKVPKMIMVKRTDSTPNWQIYHQGMGNGKWLEFTTGAQQTGTTRWNDTSPTSTLFYLGTDSDVNSSSGTYIAYVFCDVPGYSKVGTYTGNGNNDGAFIYTGFRPQWTLIKPYTATQNWQVHDTKRDGYNVKNDNLAPNNNASEADNQFMDLLSNGFKLRSSTYSATSTSYVYLAFGQSLVGSNNVPCNAR